MINSLLKCLVRLFLMLNLIFRVVYCRLRKNKIAFVYSTPMHSNLGDHAIAYAEMVFVKKKLKNYACVEVPFILCDEFILFKSIITRVEDIILTIGGGNFGDVYLPEEVCRRNLVESFQDNLIVMFPQTIHFLDDEELKRSTYCYSRHSNLVIIAREEKSYDIMKANFISNKVLLIPDIVLSIDRSKCFLNKKRSGLLLCLRSDIERSLSDADLAEIDIFIKKNFRISNSSDTISKNKIILPFSRSGEIDRKLREFASSEIVLTDRLHGMIFSAITGTPCIVFSNNNHKVAGTYKWISKLPYVKFCERPSDLQQIYQDINLGLTYSYEPSQFDKYWGLINKSIEDYEQKS